MPTIAEIVQKDIAKGTKLGKMLSKAVENAKKPSKKATMLPVQKVSPLIEYQDKILLSEIEGLGELHPCAIVGWKPGTPAMVEGKPCRVKWGLSDGKETTVVISYETPQLIQEEGWLTPTLKIVPLEKLTACECGGYIHRRICTPNNG